VERRKPTRMEWGTLRELCNVIPRFKIIPKRWPLRLAPLTARFQVNT
jgi:hypothetical protein